MENKNYAQDLDLVKQPSIDAPLFEVLLNSGMSILNLDLGIVSKVYGSNYELVEILGMSAGFVTGDILQIKSTYCRDVISTGKTVALTELDGIRGLRRHPLYTSMVLEAYIAAPIFFAGQIWGTINFSSANFHAKPFSVSEIALINAYAAIISDSLSSKSVLSCQLLLG